MLNLKFLLYLNLFVILVILFYFWKKSILHRGLAGLNNKNSRLKNEYSRLKQANAKINQENRALGDKLAENVALYEITREICKYLDEEKVFLSFNEQVRRYIELKDCRLVKGNVDTEQFRGMRFLPLEINKNIIGYIVAEGVSEENAEKFNILAQQCILGVKRAILYQRVQELAVTDSLTQVLSRRYWLERLKEEIARSLRLGYKLSCLMMDIDRFKEYNDRYGHLVGDVILKEISKAVKENIREIDIIGRYGGEEFFVALTETDKNAARIVAERIRKAVEERVIKAYDEDLKVTISIGISSFPEDSREMAVLIDKADQALYEAKKKGRNKVCAS